MLLAPPVAGGACWCPPACPGRARRNRSTWCSTAGRRRSPWGHPGRFSLSGGTRAAPASASPRGSGGPWGTCGWRTAPRRGGRGDAYLRRAARARPGLRRPGAGRPDPAGLRGGRGRAAAGRPRGAGPRRAGAADRAGAGPPGRRAGRGGVDGARCAAHGPGRPGGGRPARTGRGQRRRAADAGRRARLLAAAHLAAGSALGLWGLGRRSGGWAAAGGLLAAQGIAGLAYDRFRSDRARLSVPPD